MRVQSRLLICVVVFMVSVMGLAQDDEDTIPGQIAYIGTDYNVYVLSKVGEDPIQLTDDASGGIVSMRRYQMPTWATDGRLAYFATDITPDAYRMDVVVSSDAASTGDIIYTAEDEVLNYAAWSPQNCDGGATCRELAMLLNSRVAGGLFVKVVEDAVTEFPSEIIGRGGPFYFSWSANGENMVWQRNNNRMDVFDVGERTIVEQLPYQPGAFQTPHWSPVDDRLLIGTLNENRTSTDLTIVSGDKTESLIEGLEGVVYFSWSPDGNYVAYTMRNSSLVVLDSTTGEVLTQTIVDSIGPFFWSPDSSKVAFVTLATPEGTFTTKLDGMMRAAQQNLPDLAWSVLEVDNGETRRYSAFIPTPEMVYIMTYFDQFAKSHSLWSPDSRYLVYGEVSDDNEPVISIIDTSLQDTFPLAVANGYLGIWSYN